MTGSHGWDIASDKTTLVASEKGLSMDTSNWSTGAVLSSHSNVPHSNDSMKMKEVPKEAHMKQETPHPAAYNPHHQMGTAPHHTASTQQGTPRPQKLHVVGSNTDKCPRCGKTVYPLEGIHALDKFWHKVCFRCEGEGCTIVLNNSNYETAGGKIFCHKHAPKEKPTQTTVDGNLGTKNALAAPKPRRAPGIKKDAQRSFYHYRD